MKWVSILKDKVGFSHSPVSSPSAPRQRPPPEGGASSKERSKYESEQDFKRFWEEFRSADTEKSKEEALEVALEIFRNLSQSHGNPAQIANRLVDARLFSFVVARALVTDIERLKKSSPKKTVDIEELLNFFGRSNGEVGVGSNMLDALEVLVSPPLDIQPLLDAGLLPCLVAVLYRLLGSSITTDIVSLQETLLESANETVDFHGNFDKDESKERHMQIEGKVIHIMKALARHPGAAQSLLEDNSLQLLFQMVVITSSNQSASSPDADTSICHPLHLAQLQRHVMQILRSLLVSDNGSAAKYIHTHQLIKVLLKAVKAYDSQVWDAAFVIGVVSLLLECLQLSCKPEAGTVRLRADFQNAHGYQLLVQLALKLSDTPDEFKDLDSVSSEGSSSKIILLSQGKENHQSVRSSLSPFLIQVLDIFIDFAQTGAAELCETENYLGNIKGKPLSTKSVVHTRRLSFWDGSEPIYEKPVNTRVKDIFAVQVLQDIFLKTGNVDLQLEVLDRLLGLFASHAENYKLVQDLRTLPLFILNMSTFPQILQDRLLKVLEYAVTVVNCVPEQELLSLCCLLQQPLACSLRCRILSFFVKLISFDRHYRKLFREVGLLDVLIDDVKCCEPSATSADGQYFKPKLLNSDSSELQTHDFETERVAVSVVNHIFNDENTLSLAWDCMLALVKDSDGNQAAFRKSNGAKAVLPLVASSLHRLGVLRLLSCMICEDTSQSHPEELGALVDIVNGGLVTTIYGKQWTVDNEAKREILWAIWRILSVNPATKEVFGEAKGFSMLQGILQRSHPDQVEFEDAFSSTDEVFPTVPTDALLESLMEVFNALLYTVTMAVSGSTKNRARLQELISFSSLKHMLSTSGLVCSEFENHAVDLLLDLSIEKIRPPSRKFRSSTLYSQSSLLAHGEKGVDLQVENVKSTETKESVLTSSSNADEDILYNVGAVELLFYCFSKLSHKAQLSLLSAIEKLACRSCYNKDRLTSIGCIGLLLEFVRPSSVSPSAIMMHALHIVESLGAYRLTSSELRTLLRYTWQCKESVISNSGYMFVEMMERMAHGDASENFALSPFFELNMSRVGYACIHVTLGDRSWPPTAGYSFACWIRFQNFLKRGSADQQIQKDNLQTSRVSEYAKAGSICRIFAVELAEEKHPVLTEFYLTEAGILTLATGPNSQLSFKNVRLEEGAWYHLAIVHNKPNALAGLFQSSVANLYINGCLKYSGKLGYLPSSAGKKLGYLPSSAGKKLQLMIGTPPSLANMSPLTLQLGSCYLFEEVLTAPAICLMYILGRGYHGLFQDSDLLRFVPLEACGGGNLAVLEALDTLSASATSTEKWDSSSKQILNKVDGSDVVWELERLLTFWGQLSTKKLILAVDGSPADSSNLSALIAVANLVDPFSAAASPLGGLPRLGRLHGEAYALRPCNLGDSIRKVGGVGVVLALVEIAESKEMLHLALTLLVNILHYNPCNTYELLACRGYHLLALFLHRRMNLFMMQDLELLFQIAASESSVQISSEVSDALLLKGDNGNAISEADVEMSKTPVAADDQTSSVGSALDALEDFVQEEDSKFLSDLGGSKVQEEALNSVVLANSEMMEHVLLDWTLWVTAPISIQLALLDFIERLVAMHRYRNHNLTILRRLNIVQHLLVTLQRGDVEIIVLEKLVLIIVILLEDGFLPSELKYVADFVLMTFDPPELQHGSSSLIPEPMGMHIIVRNMLLETLIALQITISDEEHIDTWHKVVSSKLIIFFLDEAVHPTSIRWVMTMLGVCLSSSNFALKFRSSGGYQTLVQVLPSFYDTPEVYYILFSLLLGRSVYPRQPEVRMLDFHALMPNDGSLKNIFFPELLDCILAMSKAAFDKMSLQSEIAQQTGDFSKLTESLVAGYSDSDKDMAEELQGEALLHKTYAALLMSGEAAAPALVTSLLRFMVDLAKMCRPFSAACRRLDFLETCVDLYFSCSRSACAIKAAQGASCLGSSTRSEDFTNKPLLQRELEPGHNSIEISASSRSKEIDNIKSMKMGESFQEEMACASAFKEVVPAGSAEGANSLDLDEGKSGHSSLSSSFTDFTRPQLVISASRQHPSTPKFVFGNELLSPKEQQLTSSSSYGAPTSWLGSSWHSESISKSPASTLGTTTTFQSNPDFRQELEENSSHPKNGRFPFNITPELLLQLEATGARGGPCPSGAAAVLDLIAEILADALTEQIKATPLVESTLEAVALHVASDSVLVFQGLCLGRLITFLERRLIRDDEEADKKLDKTRWTSNLEAISWVLVDHLYLGAFQDPGGSLKVLEFLLAMLQLANKDSRVEEAVPAGRGILSLTRTTARQVEPYAQALLKNTNRAIIYCFFPQVATGFVDGSLSRTQSDCESKLLTDIDSVSLSKGMDSTAVLQLLLANKKIIFCASNVDVDLLHCLFVKLVPMLHDSNQAVRAIAVDVCKALLMYRKDALEEVLVYRPSQGQAMNILNGGFSKLMSSNVIGFFTWFDDNYELVQQVIEKRASSVWKELIVGATRFRDFRVKAMESRRRREMQRRAREVMKLQERHWERAMDKHVGLDVVRETMASELRAMRQDKYGWVLHAESEWEDHKQQLVHERAVLAMSNSAMQDQQWELCPTEGPYRMRKKLQRCKPKVDMIGSILQDFDQSEAEEGHSTQNNNFGDHMDSDDESFFHLFSLGAEKQIALQQSTKDDIDSFVDEEDATKGIDEDRDSASAKVGWTEQRSSSYDTGPIAFSEANEKIKSLDSSSFTEEAATLKPKSSLPTSFLIGDVKPSLQNMPKVIPDDGEYLIRPYLEPGEKIRFRYNCERVVGLDKHDGIFLIGELCLYVIENYFIDETGCICEKIGEGDLSVIDQALGVKQSSPSLPLSEDLDQSSALEDSSRMWPGGRAWAYSGGAWGKEKISGGYHMPHSWHMWKLDSVHELLKRRYQLRPVAIELFSMDGCNDLLVFHKGERDDVFKNLLAMNLPRNSMLDTTVSGISKQGGGEGRLFKVMAHSFSKRWQNGEISNFQYLMHLNTLAGRGYNDLTQYPVFPWVLADYESEELDLNNPCTFRCLTKPMGALWPEREEEFKKRYETWDDPEIPKFHYGSHYSSAGTVLFYLIRLQPFTRENLKLQGGQFDHADRLFTSLHDTWLSASQGNTADVKELIPEFFYLSEFLENRLDLDLGFKQSGEKVDDVLLPPWAKGSAREFVRKHREALECEYVSENLHHWIDLIFGYRQRGKAAVEATNMFFYLTYEGAVEIDSVQDPAMKSSILAQINHFGQTPRQLFLKPHPQKKSHQKLPLLHALSNSLALGPQDVRANRSSISQVVVLQDKIYVAGQNQWLKPRSCTKYVQWGFPDNSLRFVSYDQDKLLSTHEQLHDGPIHCARFSLDGRVLVTGGDDGVVAVWRLRKDGIRGQRRLHLRRSMCGHTSGITCVAVSQPYSLIVSGSKDCTVIFWDYSNLEFVRQLPELPVSPSAVHINDKTGEVVVAAGVILAVWSINGECLAAINSALYPSESIASITTPLFSDWMVNIWYVTGHQNGAVKLWRLEQPNAELARVPRRSRSYSMEQTPRRKSEKAFTASLADLSGHSKSSDIPLKCITGGIPDYQIVLQKVLKGHNHPVTALFLTTDLKQLYSGDAGGHILSWSIAEEVPKSNSMQEHQVEESCTLCQHSISGIGMKYYCRNCGRAACRKCGTNYVVLEDLGFSRPVQVCWDCFESRKMMPFFSTGTPSISPSIPGYPIQ